MNVEIKFSDSPWTKYAFFIAILIGAYFIYQDHKIAKASPSWPDVSGLIIESHITEQVNDPIQKSSSFFARRVYVLNVKYQYEVNRIQLTGTKIGKYKTQFSTETQAADALRQFVAGTEVKVFYDPKSPKTSVLFPG